MSSIVPKAELYIDEKNNDYQCRGPWSILNLNDLLLELKNASSLPQSKNIKVSGKQLTAFDSSGALLLKQYLNKLSEHGNQLELVDFSPQHLDLIHLIEDKDAFLHYQSPQVKQIDFVSKIGKETIKKYGQVEGFVGLIGDFTKQLLGAFGQWRRFHLTSIFANIYNSGITALPIIGLLAFLIGVVLVYQMGIQLETYGANNFIAYLSGMAIFREFAPLITAIIVAGRTSSAYTAQIGSMKIHEEIDALHTMGLSPTELLVLPKVLGLFFIFPLLIFWADIFSVIGAMIMSKSMLNIGYYDYLARLRDAVGLKQLMLGLYKAPAFSLLIALVGCFQGLRVEFNADSVGKQTTKSVVQALFLIIVVDSIYSVIYSWLDL